MRKTLPRFTARWLIPIRGRRIPRRVCICAHPKRRLHNGKCRNCHGYMYHRPTEPLMLSYCSIDFVPAAPTPLRHLSAFEPDPRAILMFPGDCQPWLT